MMGMLWVVLFVALAGSHCGYGLPVRPTPQDYPHDGLTSSEGWAVQGGMYAVIPALALIITAITLIAGCAWCCRHKDWKIFTASASHLHTTQPRRAQAPDSGFSEPVNNNINEDNNNGPISLREMQNIANNNATAYIVSENEERNNRYSRESIVEFEPLPAPFIGDDPLEHCADWFGEDDFPRGNLQYLRELGRGWFGRVVAGEVDEAGSSTNVAVKILNQNATLQQKAQFLDEAKIYREGGHENILTFIGKCLQEEPWILIFELCTVDLQQYLVANRPKMAALNESGVPLRLMCDVSSALSYLHSRGITYGWLWGGSVQTRGLDASARAVLGRYEVTEPSNDCIAPEVLRRGADYTTSSEIWSLGTLIWEICSWGAIPTERPSPPPELPCPYKDHLYQVMQLCWHTDPSERPTAAQVHALISHLHATLTETRAPLSNLYSSTDFEERWERLKPNSIPKLDEHIAIVHAPSTSTSASASRYAGSDREFDHNVLGIDSDIVVSRSSSIMSDRDPLSVQLKSESLTNLHGSLEDVRNIYLTHNETPTLECHQGNILEDARERELDRSDTSMDPWVKDIMAGSQDDVSYYKDVSDVIKNLDNILNSEKTSSSESSHQASPSRDNLNLDCKKEYTLQSSLVKSPGITNFQNILDTGFGGEANENNTCAEEDEDRETIGTLSHSFERHSDSISQHTLENMTPDTPMRDFDVFVDIEHLDEEPEITKVERQTEAAKDFLVETNKSVEQDTELPKVVDSNIPKLKELCVMSIPSVSETNEQSLVRKDCQTECDNVTETRTDNEETKSIDDIRKTFTDSKPLEETEVTDFAMNEQIVETKNVEETILPISVEETILSVEGMDTLPSITDEITSTTQDNTSNIKLESNLEDNEPYSIESENNYSKDETILVSDIVDTITDSSKDEIKNYEELVKVDIEVDLESVPEQMPVSVQTIIDDIQEPADLKLNKKADSEIKLVGIMPTHSLPEIVQNTDNNAPVLETENLVRKEIVEAKNYNVDNKDSESIIMNRSDSYVEIGFNEQSVDSTVYIDLINNTNSQILNNSLVNDSVKEEVNSAFEVVPSQDSEQESTVYLDLPSFDIKKKAGDFLHMEKVFISKYFEDHIIASTPITSDNSAEVLDNSVENSVQDETIIPSETKVLEKPKQKIGAENISPFDSPSHKSHHTDTYDENSSVVLGPFENCTELCKSAKTHLEPVELPKEELLAFSSNFSEMNLATPSPLRDGNFLNEVPDILPDDSQLEDLASISEPKLVLEMHSDDTDDSGSGTQKHVSPLTPPNSPGIFLASTSKQKYLIDIDVNTEPEPIPNDLNQIELQITSKLAMAENENNLNIEYSGPLTVEGLIEEAGAMRESDAIPESYLAGNGGLVVNIRQALSLDAECVKALRNELELKLPLAQVAAIEPQCEGESEWQSELPPPPELVVNYPGALSPIVEETSQQLSAYENNINWNPSTRTESSESYPEPCNMSSESEACASAASHRTYTLPPDTNKNSQRGLTMSADSLNASLHKSKMETTPSTIDERTYNKEDENIESNCERISQVSPFLVSPTTNTSDNDIATRVSTLSKTTLPTDAKHSKPETQNLSKATSIDSWCSNDTLYNVEENFDDLAMDPDIPQEYDKEEHSHSTDTLTHNDDKELSHCSTYIIHDSKSEACDTYAPDSITANENYTYTKVKTEAAGATTSVLTKSDLNDSTKNTQTKDLAYGTLMSGMPSLSNCTREMASGFDDVWKLPHPELVRRSPMENDVTFSCPPNQCEDKEYAEHSSPHLSSKPLIGRMESVEISCLGGNFFDSPDTDTEKRYNLEVNDSPINDYINISHSKTSTPLFEQDDEENVQPIPLTLSGSDGETSISNINLPTFQKFQQSAEVRPQDLSNTKNVMNDGSEGILEDESKTLTLKHRERFNVSQQTPTLSGFKNSVTFKPQNTNSLGKTTHTFESSVSCNPQDTNFVEKSSHSDFQNSAVCKPHDLNSVEKPTYSEFENSMACDSQDTNSVEKSSHSDFQNSAVCKPHDLNSAEKSTYSEFENSTACDSQDTNSVEKSSYSNFINSAICKPQNSNSVEKATYSEFENSMACNPQNTNSLEKSSYSNFENSVACKPQNSNSVEKPSQRIESVVSSEYFHHIENAVKSRPQDLSSMVDASSLLLRSERISSELAMSSYVGIGDQPRQSNNERMQSLNTSPPSVTNLIESHALVTQEPSNALLINFDMEDEAEQPHSIIVTEVPMNSFVMSQNITYDSHAESNSNFNMNYDSHDNRSIFSQTKMNGDIVEQPQSLIMIEEALPSSETDDVQPNKENTINGSPKDLLNGSTESPKSVIMATTPKGIQLNGGSERYATFNFLNETFEELVESSVDDSDSKEDKLIIDEDVPTPETTVLEESLTPIEDKSVEISKSVLPESSTDTEDVKTNGIAEEDKVAAVTEDFLQNEKKYATLDSCFPMLSDIRFTGPATEMMSTSFQDSPTPTSPTSPECEQDSKTNPSADVMKEWDSDSDSHSSNSSSGEFIWKQRSTGPPAGEAHEPGSGASEGSGDSGSGSEGDEVDFVPSSWDCRAEPSKSSLRSLEATPESKKRVVFKRQKYHCVYEYPREAAEVGPHSPAYLPDLSTYCEWDPSSASEAELCYGQLFAAPSALAAAYPLRAGVGPDYDEDFFISSSARPFETLGLMSTTSQFFPGMKRALLERSLSDESPLQLQPSSPPPITTTLDLTTPDSGVEDITPSSTIDEEFVKREDVWRIDGSSSESASPSSPGESLGGLRHTRDRLKLDLPPSPHAASPKHARVFNFTLEKPKRREVSTPLVMTDETPILPPLPILETEPPPPEPTFSTFGKTAPKSETEQKIILTDESETEVEPKVVEAVKGEGTVLDSGDEDSGIESSSKATLERNTPNVS